MENKESYTPGEVEFMLEEHEKYLNSLRKYNESSTDKDKEFYKTLSNYQFGICEKKIPKSLIDKFGIKKIE